MPDWALSGCFGIASRQLCELSYITSDGKNQSVGKFVF